MGSEHIAIGGEVKIRAQEGFEPSQYRPRGKASESKGFVEKGRGIQGHGARLFG